jgi:hypothetical protein
MKLLFCVLLLTSLITPSAVSQQQQLDRGTKRLKGSVKSVDSTGSVIDKSSGRLQSKRYRIGREEFDASGNLTVETRYGPSGDVFAVLTYSFLDRERVVKEEIKSRRAPAYTVKLKYKYDSNGNRTEATHIFSNGSTSGKEVYTFSGNEKEELSYSADGSLLYKYVHKLDDKGNELETVTTRYEGTRNPLQTTTTYKYLEFDAQGNWTKRVEARDGESLLVYRTIRYH